jgi:YD repeat-containing protein
MSLIFLSCLFFSACKKNSSNSSNIGCLLTEDDNSFAGVKLEYDGAGKLTKVTSMGSDTSFNIRYNLYYDGNGNANKIDLFTNSNKTGIGDGYFTPILDSKGNISTFSYYKNSPTGGQLQNTFTYTYDFNNNLIGSQTTNGQNYRYLYDTSHNVVQIYYKDGLYPEYLQNNITSYDSKVNPFHQNKYLVALTQESGNSKHNPLVEFDFNQDGTPSGTISYSYAYGSNNLPQTITEIDKFVGQADVTYPSSLKYSCQ